MTAELLVTGCYRSGTTLLEKLLHAHPSACVASQPFPGLYTHVKQLFDESRGVRQRYPLSHRFLETGYSDNDFASFLDQRELTDGDIDAIFEQLARHSEGHWTPEVLEARAIVRPGKFVDVYRQLMQVLLGVFPKTGALVVGSKEILLEEYVPYLLEQGIYVIIIVRDPRDMIASLNFRERDNATGANRPVLYSIRIWRKSVATVLQFEGHPRFHWLRYEDLVEDPVAKLSQIAMFSKLPAFPPSLLAQPVRDQRGENWAGNSSFHDQSHVSREPVGRFREILPHAVRSMIETATAPELSLLGYGGARPIKDSLLRYRDPFPTVHPSFPPDYSSDAERVRRELERLETLTSSEVLSEADARRWFLYPAAYWRLRKAVRSE